jgi:hypothetical protein
VRVPLRRCQDSLESKLPPHFIGLSFFPAPNISNFTFSTSYVAIDSNPFSLRYLPRVGFARRFSCERPDGRPISASVQTPYSDASLHVNTDYVSWRLVVIILNVMPFSKSLEHMTVAAFVRMQNAWSTISNGSFWRILARPTL